MLSVQIICVGKLKEKFYIDAVAEYEKRLGGYCKYSICELSEERLPDHPSPAQIEAALAKEGAALLARVPKAAASVALCVEGQSLSSEGLSEKMAAWAGQGRSQLCFFIGSSYGLHADVKKMADFRLSISQMTFPHHLARVIILEQIYRAFKIQEGATYHK